MRLLAAWPPETWAFAGVVATTAAGYLAGRNRWLVKASTEMAEAYRDLIGELRSEIDRLKEEVAELRQLLSRRRVKSQ